MLNDHLLLSDVIDLQKPILTGRHQLGLFVDVSKDHLVDIILVTLKLNNRFKIHGQELTNRVDFDLAEFIRKRYEFFKLVDCNLINAHIKWLTEEAVVQCLYFSAGIAFQEHLLIV